MRKLIIFRPDRGELRRYRQVTETQSWDSFYRLSNAGGIPSASWTIAEHYDSSDSALPEIGYRLTETDPDNTEQFRDSGWQVSSRQVFETPDDGQFSQICLCYCTYTPLSEQEQWSKLSHRIEVL